MKLLKIFLIIFFIFNFTQLNAVENNNELINKISKNINKIYFSTDINEIIKKEKKLGITIINRPKYLTNSKALFEEALVHAYKKILIIHPKPIKYFCD